MSSPLLSLLVELTTLLVTHFAALPEVRRRRSGLYRCIARDERGRRVLHLPEGRGETATAAVEEMLRAFAEALPWEPWYVPTGPVAHAATDGACGCDDGTHAEEGTAPYTVQCDPAELGADGRDDVAEVA